MRMNIVCYSYFSAPCIASSRSRRPAFITPASCITTEPCSSSSSSSSKRHDRLENSSPPCRSLSQPSHRELRAWGSPAPSPQPKPKQLPGGCSVFRIHVMRDTPRFDMPLLLGSLSSCTRTAFACSYEGSNYLVTSASAVMYSTQVSVFKPGVPQSFSAKVHHISLDCDLAVLSIAGAGKPKAKGKGGRRGPAAAAAAPGRARAAGDQAEDEEREVVELEGEDEEGDDEERFWAGVRGLELGGLPQRQHLVEVLLLHSNDRHSTDDADVSSGGAAAPQPPSDSSSSSSGGSGGGSSRTGTVQDIKAVPYPSSLQALLGLVVLAKVGSSSCVGAPLLSADGRCAGLVLRRVPRQRVPPAGGGGGGGGEGGGGERHRRRRARRGVGQARSGAEECVVAAATPMLRRFLDGVAAAAAAAATAAPSAAPPVGLPSLGLKVKALAAAPMRRALGMSEQQQGVLVLAVNPCSTSSQVLQPGDVLMAINELSINNQGSVALRHSDDFIPFTAFVAQQPLHSTVVLQVLRAGQELRLELRLEQPVLLLPMHLGNRRPQYIVCGGLVLARCSVPYLKAAFGSHWMKVAPIKLLDKLRHFPTSADEEVVVVAECQPLRSLGGYLASTLQHRALVAVNGTPALNMRQVAKQVLECSEEFLRLDLEGNIVLVMDTAQAHTDTKLMLQEYEVRLPVSEDLAALIPSLHKTRKPQSLRLGSTRRGK